VLFLLIAHENRRQMRTFAQVLPATCTKSGHVLVDGLHSVDFRGDKVASFLLTPKLKGVKP
jgi:hypothetical protein